MTVEEAKQFLRQRRRLQKTEKGRQVSKILYEIDPMDYKRFDVPGDEYDSEAEMIVERVSAGEPLSTELVWEIFERMFSSDRIDEE